MLQEKIKERPPGPARTTTTFENGYRLLTDPRPGAPTLRLIDPAGSVRVVIRMTEAGAEIDLTGEAVNVVARQRLTLDAPEIDIKADRELRLRSNGDLDQSADRHLRLQTDRGDIHLAANDDVRLDGERVKLNCQD